MNSLLTYLTSGALVNLCLIIQFYILLAFGISEYIALGFGYATGAAASYFLNSKYVFKTVGANSKKARRIKFFVFFILNALANVAMYSTLRNADMAIPAAQLISLAFSTVLGFMVQKYFIFKSIPEVQK